MDTGHSFHGHGSPFDRLGPSDSGASGSESGQSSQLGEVNSDIEDPEDGDRIPIHPDWDMEFEQGQGAPDEQVKELVLQCLHSPLTNAQRKELLEKYPLPGLRELRPPNS